MLDAAGNRKVRNRLAQVDAWTMAWGPKEAGDGIKGLPGSSMPVGGREGERREEGGEVRVCKGQRQAAVQKQQRGRQYRTAYTLLIHFTMRAQAWLALDT